jgi:hypothetical protein
MTNKLKNTWSTIKTKVDESLTFKANYPFNKEGRVSPFNKDFYKKPYGKSNTPKNIKKPQ